MLRVCTLHLAPWPVETVRGLLPERWSAHELVRALGGRNDIIAQNSGDDIAATTNWPIALCSAITFMYRKAKLPNTIETNAG